MKVAFRVLPKEQNPEYLIEIEDGGDIDSELKKYLLSPNLLYEYRIAQDDEISMVKLPPKRG